MKTVVVLSIEAKSKQLLGASHGVLLEKRHANCEASFTLNLFGHFFFTSTMLTRSGCSDAIGTPPNLRVRVLSIQLNGLAIHPHS